MAEYLAYIVLGSNIRPAENTRFAIQFLGKQFRIHAISTTWETAAVGRKVPNFLNTAVSLWTDQDPDTLNYSYFRPIEEKLGRIRYPDQNAPRTMDIDCIIYDNVVLDPTLWEWAHLALPLSELIPEIRQPETNLTLREISRLLQQKSLAHARLDLHFPLNPI